MLSGLTSRCTMLRACTAIKASITGAMTRSASAKGMLPPRRRKNSAKFMPSRYSITMYAVPLSRKTVSTDTMLGLAVSDKGITLVRSVRPATPAGMYSFTARRVCSPTSQAR